MTKNQLSDGVGRKIVEALKRQAEADVVPVQNEQLNVRNSIPLADVEETPEIKFDSEVELAEPIVDEIVEEEILIEQQTNNSVCEQTVVPQNAVPSTFEQVVPNDMKKVTIKTSSNVNIPKNVSVLSNLINNLPVGVSKQTGAVIIKQTLEAMGIPINNVLKEAQAFQDELNSLTKESMLKREEYKAQIAKLDILIQENQQNISSVNDIMSLFLNISD